MTGNLSRTVLRGAGARESACLPDLTKCILGKPWYKSERQIKKRNRNFSFYPRI
jgi:hypothetical protein